MCQSRIVAAAGHLSINTCDGCKTISLTIGPLTLRLEPQALNTLKDVINHAVWELNRAKAGEEKLAH